MTVLLAKEDFDAAIFARQAFEEGSDSRIRGGVVGQAEFPVFINLPAHRGDGNAEEAQVAVVDRQDDRNDEPVGERENSLVKIRAHLWRKGREALELLEIRHRAFFFCTRSINTLNRTLSRSLQKCSENVPRAL